MTSAWRHTWQADLQRVLREMHPGARQKFEHYGPAWPIARSLFVLAARRLGFEVAYIAYIMEQVELTIAEVSDDLRQQGTSDQTRWPQRTQDRHPR